MCKENFFNFSKKSLNSETYVEKISSSRNIPQFNKFWLFLLQAEWFHRSLLLTLWNLLRAFKCNVVRLRRAVSPKKKFTVSSRRSRWIIRLLVSRIVPQIELIEFKYFLNNYSKVITGMSNSLNTHSLKLLLFKLTTFSLKFKQEKCWVI